MFLITHQRMCAVVSLFAIQDRQRSERSWDDSYSASEVKICDKSKYPGIYQKAVDSATLYKSKTGISMLLPNPNTFCLPCERLSQLQLRLPAPEKHRISKLKMMVDLAAAWPVPPCLIILHCMNKNLGFSHRNIPEHNGSLWLNLIYQ